MKIFNKLFCNHEWETHSKKEYHWKERIVVAETRHWFNPIVDTVSISKTVKVLICKKCGKIKTITY